VSLSDLFTRRRKDDQEGEAAASAAVYPTKALPHFLASLGTREQPVLLDLGSVVGSNVSFFGEQLGCKIFVEELSKDIDRHVRDDRLDDFPVFLERRFSQPPGSIDGILCWDLFDYLEKPAAQALSAQLTRLLRPDGALLAFFATSETADTRKAEYTRHIVVDQTTLQYRPYPAARGKQRTWLNRDIQRLFEPLLITEQFLLKTNLREVLLRKPEA
jgi:hypothetical protein